MTAWPANIPFWFNLFGLQRENPLSPAPSPDTCLLSQIKLQGTSPGQIHPLLSKEDILTGGVLPWFCLLLSFFVLFLLCSHSILFLITSSHILFLSVLFCFCLLSFPNPPSFYYLTINTLTFNNT
jgi:hypothetical protein